MYSHSTVISKAFMFCLAILNRMQLLWYLFFHPRWKWMLTSKYDSLFAHSDGQKLRRDTDNPVEELPSLKFKFFPSKYTKQTLSSSHFGYILYGYFKSTIRAASNPPLFPGSFWTPPGRGGRCCSCLSPWARALACFLAWRRDNWGGYPGSGGNIVIRLGGGRRARCCGGRMVPPAGAGRIPEVEGKTGWKRWYGPIEDWTIGLFQPNLKYSHF